MGQLEVLGFHGTRSQDSGVVTINYDPWMVPRKPLAVDPIQCQVPAVLGHGRERIFCCRRYLPGGRTSREGANDVKFGFDHELGAVGGSDDVSYL